MCFALAPAFRLADWRKNLNRFLFISELGLTFVFITQQLSAYLQHQTTAFCSCQHPTTIVCLPFITLLRLCPTAVFSLTTLLTNYVSRNQFINYCVYVFFNNLYQPFHLLFQQPFTFLQPISPTNHFVPGFNHFCHSLRFFLYNHVL